MIIFRSFLTGVIKSIVCMCRDTFLLILSFFASYSIEVNTATGENRDFGEKTVSAMHL